MLGRFFGADKGESAESLKAKGNAALQQGALSEAEDFYRQAIDADPDYMPAHYNLGNVLGMRRAYGEALAAYQKASELAPDDYEIFVNLGVTLNSMARSAEAVAAFDKAAQLAPGAVKPLVNRGVALSRLGRHDEAIAAYGVALQQDTGCSVARYYRSLEYLLLERWQEGFLEHESRLDLPGAVPEDLLVGKEEWDGSDLSGQTLLIYPEQGMGDMIQFLRYAPLCRQRGARVMVCCHPPLAPLLELAPDLDVVVPDGTALPEAFDTYISVMSLAYVFGRQPELPPLRLDVPARAHPALSGASGVKVGVCWSGNPGHGRDYERSIPEGVFRDALSGIDNLSLFSIQMDNASQDFATPLAPHIADFLDTAALVRQLDLVVTVDTSLAHLCGSLGVPAWVLVTYSPDWRWGTRGESSAWYPSLRIFRQAAPGQWKEPLAEVRRRLAEKAGQR